MSLDLPKIQINSSKVQFFIAVCMIRGHSFISAGFNQITGNGQRSEFLLDLGKSIILEKRKQGMLSILWQMFNNTLDAKIQNERLLVDLKTKQEQSKRQFEYMAFEIDYSNYLSLLGRLKQLSPDIKAYIPISEQAKEVTLSFDSLKHLKIAATQSVDIEQIAKNKDKLSFHNHCRLDAQRLLHSSFPTTSKDDFGVSASIQGPLLCRASITEGKLDKELIILPPPPSAYNLGVEQTKTLNKLYKRMQHILLLDQDGDLTKEKFEKTKLLYKSIVAKQNPSLEEVINSILTWADENHKLVDKHRRCWSFFQPTATRQLVEELKNNLHI